jgi:two-component system cell cycle sensor histidine kinase/response regulator CckA
MPNTIHASEDVTELERLRQRVAEVHGLSEQLQARIQRMETESSAHTQQLADANERLRATNEALTDARAEGEGNYRTLFEANPLPMWLFDVETLEFLAVNAAATHQYGYSRDEFLNMTIKDIRPSEDVPLMIEAVSDIPDGFRTAGEWRHRKKDGTVFDVEIASHALSFAGRRARLVSAIDITDRKRLEAQLLQAQKMEGIGRLAGGVAHDFNNLLTAIIGYSQLLLDSYEEDDRKRSQIVEIEKAGRRAASLTRQLLAFSRQQMMLPRVLNLNDVVADTEKMLRRLIGEDIEMVTLRNPDLGSVKADPGQIEQVLMNLVVNARDAMPEGGKLLIETNNVRLDDSYACRHPYTRLGAHVVLAVSDNGAGMDSDTQSHIFEPFYTTKELGKGTGLGLSTVYGIVKQSGGQIEVYSEPRKGTTFRIYLPRVAEQAEALTTGVRSDLPEEGSETILLVEDDQMVRVFAEQVLSSKGYEVLTAACGSDAMTLSQEYKGTIDLLLTDTVMPGMSGPQLAQQLGQSRPETTVIYMSGYTDEAVIRHGVLDEGVHFIQKPFPPDDLARKVREVLDGRLANGQKSASAGQAIR